MSSPLVSIVMACFNHASYVEASIRSVMEHDYDNIEFLVVDDGSTDNSLAIIRALQAEYGFKVITQENQGVTKAVNTGFYATKGEFFASFDSDDIMLPGRIRLQVEYLQTRPEVGGCGANFEYIDAQGNHKPGALFKKAASYQFHEFFVDRRWLGGPTAFFRRQAILDAGGYDLDNPIQDTHLELKVAHAGYRLDIIENIVTLYRRHDTNISSNDKGNFKSHLLAINKFQAEPGYAAAKRGLIHAELKKAVAEDRAYAKELFALLPLKEWNTKTLKRFWRYSRKRFSPDFSKLKTRRRAV